jgi:hypothetical protein
MRMGAALPVSKGSGVVNCQPDLREVLRIGDHSKSRFHQVCELSGGPAGGDGFDAHLGEGLVMDAEGMGIASVTATFRHDHPFRVGILHGRLSMLCRELK